MASQRIPNEWAGVIQAQSYANLKHDLEEKSLITLNKQLYKSELESQFQEKQAKKEQEKQFHDLESQVMQKNVKAFENYQEKLKNDKKIQQNVLFNEYFSNISQKRNLRLAEKNQALESDKEFVNKAKLQQQNDEYLKRNQKQEKNSLEQNFLLARNRLKDEEVKVKETEKKIDQELIQLNIEKVNKRDQDYKNLFENIERNAEIKKKVYEPVSNASQMRIYQNYDVINNWEKEAKKKQQDKELQELQKKLNNRREISEGLKSQLNEKNKKFEMLKADYNLEKNLVTENINIYKSTVEKAKIEKARAREDYFKDLAAQKAEKDLQKMTSKLMNDKEKVLNSELLKKIDQKQEIEFRAVPGLHPRVSPLQNTFNRAHKSMTGFPEPTPQSNGRNISQEARDFNMSSQNQDYQRLSPPSYDVDFTKHNPITNPIGSPNQNYFNSPFYRGKGISSLNTGNIFKI